MKGLPRFAPILSAIMMLATHSIYAAMGDGSPLGAPPNPEAQKTAEYIKHLGEYFGYDLTQDSKDIIKAINTAIAGTSSSNLNTPVTSISQELLDLKQLQSNEQNLTQTYLGSLLSTTTSAGAAISLVANSPTLNQSLNATYPSFGQASGNAGGITVLQAIDQKPYQNDPVSQVLLNLLSTPPDQATSANLSDKLALPDVVIQTIAPPTKAKDFFDATAILDQLNSDTLISPMLYTTSSGAATTSSPSADNQKPPAGLPTKSTAQLAADFIRYVSGAVLPLTLPSYNSIDTTAQGQAVLSQYMANLRIYAAQVSVGVSNLYYLLSKRLPQPGANNSGQTSQALSEYNMATWRLFIPGSGGTSPTQWQNAINGASAATVQKEIAVLLAEINYQLYLTRQQQERLLLTNTTLLLLSARSNAPSTSSLIPGNTPGGVSGSSTNNASTSTR